MSTEKKPNKLTEKAGLTFNVNTIKQKLKSYYEGQDLTTPMFSGGQTAMTATLEKLWEMLLQQCLKKVGKDSKTGVRLINLEALQTAVLLHPGLQRYFVVQFGSFDSEVEYKDQSPVISVEMDKVMERVDKDMSLTNKARNLACYMLLKVFSQLASTSHTLIEYAKKKSLDGRSVWFAVGTVFHGSVSSVLHNEITRAMKEFGEELEETHGDNEAPVDNQVAAAGNADAGEEEEEASTTTKAPKGGKKPAPKADATASKKAVPAKGGKKKAEAIEEEPEEPEEEAAEEPEEAEEPAKPTKKAAANTGNKKAAVPAAKAKGGKK